MPIRLLLPIALTALLLVACADDVAPGYRIEKQEIATRWQDDIVHIRAHYRLRNIGSAPLETLRISLAAVNPGAALDMRVLIDGAETKWESVQEDSMPALEVRFAQPWPRRSRKELTLEYKFPSGGSQKVASFQLLPGSWSPELLPPPGLLSKGGVAPKKWDLAVTVPQDLLVHSAGKDRGTKKRGDLLEYRFRQQKGHRYTYIVGGPYRETRAEADGFVMHFWMLNPVSRDAAQGVAKRLAQTLNTYREWLGPLESDARHVWVVDGTASRYILAGPAGGRPGLAADMIIDPALFVGGQARSESDCVADEWLAGMWVNWLATPSAETRALAENLAKHLAQSLPHGCAFRLYNAANREGVIRNMRQGFDAANKNYRADNSRLKESYRHERNGYLQRLKVFAMEERAGREPLHRAVRRMLQALGGERWTENELRSALEAETGKDWAAFFREWANADQLPKN